MPTYSTIMGALLGMLKISWKLILAKLAAQFLQLTADISTSPRDPLLSPALLVSLYTVSSLLLTIAILWESNQARRLQDKGKFVHVCERGVGTDDLEAFPSHPHADDERS